MTGYYLNLSPFLLDLKAYGHVRKSEGSAIPVRESPQPFHLEPFLCAARPSSWPSTVRTETPGELADLIL